MDISVTIGNILEQQTDGIVLNLFEGVDAPGGATGAADKALNGGIESLIASGDFTGKFKQTSVLYPRGGMPAKRVILVGLGKQEAFTLDHVRQVSAVAAQQARKLGINSLTTIVHGGGAGGLHTADAAQAVVEGTVLGTYRFSHYKTGDQDDGNDLDRLTLVEFDAAKQAEVERGALIGRIVADGTCLARDLVSHPGNELPPTVLAERAREMADGVGLSCEVLDETRIAEEGMRTLLAVAQGSAQPPRFIVLEHDGGKTDDPPVVLIGKGITFDTGGISIKGAEGMWDMKFDMGGAAAVIGAMQATARLNLPVRTVGLVAASENMPGSRALKPGDIIRSMLGKTIEIRSTDAEGRLVLADAITYAAPLQTRRRNRPGHPHRRLHHRPGARSQRIDIQQRRPGRRGRPGPEGAPEKSPGACPSSKATGNRSKATSPTSKIPVEGPLAPSRGRPLSRPSSRTFPGLTWTSPALPGPTKTVPTSPEAEPGGASASWSTS